MLVWIASLKRSESGVPAFVVDPMHGSLIDEPSIAIVPWRMDGKHLAQAPFGEEPRRIQCAIPYD
jgi:hypothetical protein